MADNETRLRVKLLACLAMSKRNLQIRMKVDRFCELIELQPVGAIGTEIAAINASGKVHCTLSGESVTCTVKDSDRGPDVTTVLEHWRSARGTNVMITDARKRTVIARLREGYTVDQLCRACDQMMQSEFHRAGGFLDVDYFAGDAAKVDRWLAKTSQSQVNDEETAIRQQMERRRGNR